MNKFYTGIILILSLSLFISCNEDSPTEPEEQKNVLASETIGSEGGQLTYEDITITIPAGGLTGTSTVEVYDYEPSADIDPVTAVYSIDGIPIDNNLPIQIELSVENQPAENTNIAIVHEEFVKSMATVREVVQILETVYEDGKLKASIPASSDAGLSKLSSINEEGKYKISIFGQVTGYKYTTSANHFELHLPANMADKAVTIGNYFEDAYTKVEQLGFNFSKRTEWPIKVHVKKLNDDGGFIAGKWSANDGFLELNESLFSKNENEFKVTIGHEFFHVIQDLYDPRGISKRLADNTRCKLTGYLPVNLWLDEAMSTWIEEKFSDVSNYISPNVYINRYQPYYGPNKGFVIDPTNHGYGMASLIKYVVGEHGEDILVKIYDKIKTGYLPMDAIQSPIETPLVLWWADYLKDYTINKIYPNVNVANYIRDAYENSTTYKIEELADGTKNFNDNFPDLSTRFYYLDLNYTVSDKNAVINCSHGTSHMTIFKTVRFDILYDDFSSDGSYEITNLNQYREAENDLLIMVTDYMGNSPYDKSKAIPLDLVITTEEKEEFDLSIYDEMLLAIKCKATRTNSAGDSDVNYEYPDNWAILKIDNFGGSFSGNTFTVDFTEQYGSYNADIEEASASATVDMANQKVTNISIDLKYSHANDEYNTFEQNIQISELPFIEKYDYMKFGIYGEEGGSAITSIKDREDDGTLFLEYKDLRFDSNSYVVLLFRQK